VLYYWWDIPAHIHKMVTDASSKYSFLRVIYNVVFHPLAKYPGPLSWRSCRLPYMTSILTGRLPAEVKRLHEVYGPIVRIAPNELSFADPQAYEEIYSNRGNSLAFPKGRVWHEPMPGKPPMLTTILDSREHARTRKKMEGGFTERAVTRQERIVQEYVELAVKKLAQAIARCGGTDAVLDIVPWFTWTTVDIIGDLAFGESFGCLQREGMDAWTSYVFQSLQLLTYLLPIRYYKFLPWILNWCTPRAVQKQLDEHWEAVQEKVDRRLDQSIKRPDLLTEWQASEKKSEPLSRDEIYSNAWLMTIAGSETSATTLSGTINRLVKNPDKLAMLTQEIREAFTEAEEITFAALRNLPYLNAVIWEGLRMSNPV
jgi:cytochrome P450